MDPKNYWNEKHLEYSNKDWINKPTIFAKFAIKYFPKRGRILELGAGQGQDSRYFVKNGFDVLATDISENALNLLEEKSLKKNLKIETKIVDLSQKLPFKTSEFEIVYSHLALHYFDAIKTSNLFKEIARVLKKDGIIACIMNTMEDPEISQFEKIEENYFQEPGKIKKRYFTTSSLKKFTEKKFETLVLDAKGETYKDEIKTLIRFVGKKK